MELNYLIFVYGSLRHGHVNHALLRDAHYHGTGATEQRFAMYLVCGYPYVTSTEARYPIVGELYTVDFYTLDILDKMEGHPHYYVRRETPVIINDERVLAWMYFRDPRGSLMSTGDFNGGFHGQEF